MRDTHRPRGRPDLLSDRAEARSPGAARAAVALTVGGSDSSGGAGIQADLATFAVHGVFGAAALARVTAQNTRGVRAMSALAPDLIRAQLEAVFDDLPIDAVKTGSLGSAAAIAEVGAILAERAPQTPLVVDPVAVAKSGARLLDEAAMRALAGELLPRATVLTPNVREAEALVGRPITDRTGAIGAAARLLELARPDRASGRLPIVVITRLPWLDRAVDLVCGEDGVEELAGDLIPDAPTHGAGCVLAAAITAALARGQPPSDAIVAAKEFVTVAIRRGLRLGPGRGPVSPASARGEGGPTAFAPAEENSVHA